MEVERAGEDDTSEKGECKKKEHSIEVGSSFGRGTLTAWFRPLTRHLSSPLQQMKGLA